MITYHDEQTAGCPHCDAPTGGRLCVNPHTPGNLACADLYPVECEGCRRGASDTLLYDLGGTYQWECIDRRATGHCPRSVEALALAAQHRDAADELWCHLSVEILRRLGILTERTVAEAIGGGWSRVDTWLETPTVTADAADICPACDQLTGVAVKVIARNDDGNTTGAHLWCWQCHACRSRWHVRDHNPAVAPKPSRS